MSSRVLAAAVVDSGAEAELRDGISRHEDGEEDRRHEVGKDKHAILRDLRVGDAFHAAEHGVEKHDGGADDDAGSDIHLEEAGEHDTHAAHLAGDVGEGDDDGAGDGDEASG